MTRRPMIGLVAVAAVVTIALGYLAVSSPSSPSAPGLAAGASGHPSTDAPTPVPTPRPTPKHELFGFVPYWEMNDGIAEHLAKMPLTTLALFSVVDVSIETKNTNQNGY